MHVGTAWKMLELDAMLILEGIVQRFGINLSKDLQTLFSWCVPKVATLATQDVAPAIRHSLQAGQDPHGWWQKEESDA